jgi:demethylmenaquinone methyltransferase/2-methoxy-6-polyprenyl-1,4-benzoquinol methylase
MKQHPLKNEHAATEERTDPNATVPLGYSRVREGEKVHCVMRHFERVAHRYDLMNTILSFGIHRLWKRAAVMALNVRPGDRVLDLCGGTGDLSLLATRGTGRSGSVILYDLSLAMMAAGRAKVKRGSRSPVHMVQGDAENLALAPESFDRVIIGFGVRNLTHNDRVFQEIRRVLTPGGKMVCLEFARPRSRFFGWLYDLYSFSLMPILGRLLAGSGQAYRYLAESIRVFSSPDEIVLSLERAGFRSVRYRRMTGGIAVIHEGIKGESHKLEKTSSAAGLGDRRPGRRPG